MKHEHHDHCEHGNVKFCSRCDVVYCLDCKKEWGKCNLNHYSYTTWTYPYGTTSIPAYEPYTTICDSNDLTVSIPCSHA